MENFKALATRAKEQLKVSERPEFSEQYFIQVGELLTTFEQELNQILYSGVQADVAVEKALARSVDIEQIAIFQEQIKVFNQEIIELIKSYLESIKQQTESIDSQNLIIKADLDIDGSIAQDIQRISGDLHSAKDLTEKLQVLENRLKQIEAKAVAIELARQRLEAKEKGLKQEMTQGLVESELPANILIGSVSSLDENLFSGFIKKEGLQIDYKYEDFKPSADLENKKQAFAKSKGVLSADQIKLIEKTIKDLEKKERAMDFVVRTKGQEFFTYILDSGVSRHNLTQALVGNIKPLVATESFTAKMGTNLPKEVLDSLVGSYSDQEFLQLMNKRPMPKMEPQANEHFFCTSQYQTRETALYSEVRSNLAFLENWNTQNMRGFKTLGVDIDELLAKFYESDRLPAEITVEIVKQISILKTKFARCRELGIIKTADIDKNLEKIETELVNFLSENPQEFRSTQSNITKNNTNFIRARELFYKTKSYVHNIDNMVVDAVSRSRKEAEDIERKQKKMAEQQKRIEEVMDPEHKAFADTISGDFSYTLKSTYQKELMLSYKLFRDFNEGSDSPTSLASGVTSDLKNEFGQSGYYQQLLNLRRAVLVEHLFGDKYELTQASGKNIVWSKKEYEKEKQALENRIHKALQEKTKFVNWGKERHEESFQKFKEDLLKQNSIGVARLKILKSLYRHSRESRWIGYNEYGELQPYFSFDLYNELRIADGFKTSLHEEDYEKLPARIKQEVDRVLKKFPGMVLTPETAEKMAMSAKRRTPKVREEISKAMTALIPFRDCGGGELYDLLQGMLNVQ